MTTQNGETRMPYDSQDGAKAKAATCYCGDRITVSVGDGCWRHDDGRVNCYEQPESDGSWLLAQPDPSHIGSSEEEK